MGILIEREAESRSSHVTLAIYNEAKKKILHVLRTRNERSQLASLTDEQLRDIGKTRIDVMKECNRSLLDLPDNRW